MWTLGTPFTGWAVAIVINCGRRNICNVLGDSNAVTGYDRAGYTMSVGLHGLGNLGELHLFRSGYRWKCPCNSCFFLKICSLHPPSPPQELKRSPECRVMCYQSWIGRVSLEQIEGGGGDMPRGLPRLSLIVSHGYLTHPGALWNTFKTLACV